MSKDSDSVIKQNCIDLNKSVCFDYSNYGECNIKYESIREIIRKNIKTIKNESPFDCHECTIKNNDLVKTKGYGLSYIGKKGNCIRHNN